MSFADLERGLGERAPLAQDIHIDPEQDLEFKQTARLVSIQIHKINANVSAINKFVDLLGTPKDNSDLRKKLHDLTEVTREVVKDSTGDVKKLAAIEISPDDRQHRQELAKVTSDYKKAVGSFQQAQTRSADRQRTFVERAKTTLLADTASGRGFEPTTSSATEGQLLELEQRQETVEPIADAEVEFREQLIQEREGEIEQIEQGIVELNQIFKDIGTLVNEQQSFVDNIATNVYNVGQDTRQASEQLTRAHEYQRRAGRRMFYLLLVFLAVLTVVLLAVLS
ncbi:t-SNARE [Meredithblackwellia eburnea MCA 4105]